MGLIESKGSGIVVRISLTAEGRRVMLLSAQVCILVRAGFESDEYELA